MRARSVGFQFFVIAGGVAVLLIVSRERVTISDSKKVTSFTESFDKSSMHPFDHWYTQQLASEPATDEDDLMNYGMYTEPLHPCVAMTKGNEHPQAYMANMYSALVEHKFGAGVGLLHGKRVLEIGSGRGGGAAVISRCHCPDQYLGLDFNAGQVDASQKRLKSNDKDPCRLDLQQGDAMDLHDLQDDSFDVVLNLESSHCYPHFDKFVKEVWRVLKRGGTLLLGDFREGEWPNGPGFTSMVSDLERVFGHKIDGVQDITANVSQSISMRKAAIQERYERCKHFAEAESCADYWGVSSSYEFYDGSLSFMMFHVTKGDQAKDL